MTEALEGLQRIQMKLRAPKDLFNEHGQFKYRSAEAILEAAKPLLENEGLVLVFTDTIVVMGEPNRFYVQATATLFDKEGKEVIRVPAFAREAEQQKGMGAAQLTISTSSYARKAALAGLFLLDDNRDIDSLEPESEETISPEQINEIIEKVQSTESDEARFLGFVGVSTYNQIPAHRFDELMGILKTKEEKNENPDDASAQP